MNPASIFRRLSNVSRPSIIAAWILLLLAVSIAQAQAAPATRADLAIVGGTERSLRANTAQGVWLASGSIELGINVWRGWGAAANITGSHTGSIGASGVPFSSVTETFGPRYRWHQGHKLSLFGEGLVGEGNGFGSLFPGTGGSQNQSGALATEVTGGVDYRIGKQFSVRALDAGWVRTSFANGTDNVQNYLRLGAGIVFNFGK
jgi:hypothetical protein